MRRLIITAAAILLAMPTTAVSADEAQPHAASQQAAQIVQEWNADGTPVAHPSATGKAYLTRHPDGLDAVARMHGLEPGGVYTFWWIVVQDDGTFPDDIFVGSGAGVIADDSGRAKVRMSAGFGDASITGFTPDGVNEIAFANLTDTEGSIVRIEVAYHGQVEDAGDEMDAWLYDFWTGEACPPNTPNPNPAQPHCPVYFAATFS